jgi:hypothetical protein
VSLQKWVEKKEARPAGDLILRKTNERSSDEREREREQVRSSSHHAQSRWQLQDRRADVPVDELGRHHEK